MSKNGMQNQKWQIFVNSKSKNALNEEYKILLTYFKKDALLRAPLAIPLYACDKKPLYVDK